MILRNHTGDTMFSSCSCLLHCVDALEAELLSIKEGLSLALQWSNLTLQIESDCLEAINLVRKEGTDRSRFVILVCEIRSLMEV